MIVNSQLVCLRPVGVLLGSTSFCAINSARVKKGNVIIMIVIITIIIVIAVNVIVIVRLVGWRKESYFLEFMYDDVARDFVGAVFNVLLDGAKGSHNYRDCCCFEPPHSLNLNFQVFVFIF